MKYYLDEYEPIKQVMKESVREIAFTEVEVNHLVNLIDETRDYICKSMNHGYYLDVEFLDSIKSWVLYDHHLSKKQLIKFWHLYDRLPQKIQSGIM